MFRNCCLSLAASIALFAGTARAADDFFILIDGIYGTSTAEGFEGWIVAESWSLGFTRGTCHDLHFVKQMDASSAAFTGAALLGTFYPTVVLVASRTSGDGSRLTYLKLTLSNSVFTSYQTGGSGGSGFLPLEQISVQPSSVKVEAFEQDPIGGGVTPAATTTVTCQKVK